MSLFQLLAFGRLGQIQRLLEQLVQEVEQLAVDQATFDQHLQELNAAITDLEAAIAAKAEAADLTQEDQAIQDATARVKAATDALTADEVAVAPAEPNPDEPPAEATA